MSITSSVVVSASVHMPAAQRKVFVAQNFAGMLAGMLPHADNEPAIPSMVKMNKASAASALGGKATPVSFVTGLLFVTAAYANGQYGKDVDALVKGLPTVSAFAVRHALNLTACGKGINCGALKAAALSALDATLALKPKPKAAPKAEKPAIEGTAERIEEVANEPHWSEITGAVSHAADFEPVAAALNERADKARIEAEKQAAEEKAAAVAMRGDGPSMLALFEGLLHNNAEQANGLLSDMAKAANMIVITPAQFAMLQAAEQAANTPAKPARKAARKAA